VSAGPHPRARPRGVAAAPHAPVHAGHDPPAPHHPRAIRMVFFWFVCEPAVCFALCSKARGYSQTPGKYAREPMGVKYLGVFCRSSGCWLDVARPARIRLAHKKHPPSITISALLLYSTKKDYGNRAPTPRTPCISRHRARSLPFTSPTKPSRNSSHRPFLSPTPATNCCGLHSKKAS
jgi:hypothetical protein